MFLFQNNATEVESLTCCHSYRTLVGGVGADGRFHCTLCFKSYSSAGNLREHVANSHSTEETVLPCNICNKSCKNKRSFRDHAKIWHRGTVICNFCWKLFLTKEELLSHKLLKHVQ
ncbi:hypothetical protein B566_EDAN018148 [Ephemera danica]|nr:hypothetical protein B566_EDAN018148 [Ephemera danica]